GGDSAAPRKWYDSVTDFINAVTAFIAVIAASGLLLWLMGMPTEHYDSRSVWRSQAGDERDWRKKDFNDREWAYAVSPAPHKGDGIEVGEDKFPTMWISPDSTEATFRLTFQASWLGFIREA